MNDTDDTMSAVETASLRACSKHALVIMILTIVAVLSSLSNARSVGMVQIGILVASIYTYMKIRVHDTDRAFRSSRVLLILLGLVVPFTVLAIVIGTGLTTHISVVLVGLLLCVIPCVALVLSTKLFRGLKELRRREYTHHDTSSDSRLDSAV